MTTAELNCHWHIISRISCCEWSREGVYRAFKEHGESPGHLVLAIVVPQGRRFHCLGEL